MFVAGATERSFAAAARSLAKSPQAVTRAVAAVEQRIGVRLLHRTTRSVSLTDDGARWLERARHAVAELTALETPLDTHAPLAGTIAITAPVLFGQLHVLPVVTDFLTRHPGVDARLTFVDRVVSLAEEAIDVAIRLGPLPDSALRARTVGHVRSVVCAAPRYLARAGTPRTPAALRDHACISFTGTTPIADRWTFPGLRPVAVHPRLVVDAAQAAIDAAVAGLGVTRVLSYQVAKQLSAGKLRILLASHEPPAIPVHLVTLAAPLPRAPAAFVMLAAQRLAICTSSWGARGEPSRR